MTKVGIPNEMGGRCDCGSKKNKVANIKVAEIRRVWYRIIKKTNAFTLEVVVSYDDDIDTHSYTRCKIICKMTKDRLVLPRNNKTKLLMEPNLIICAFVH